MQSQETWDLLVGDGRWPDCFPSRSLMCNMQVVMRSSEVTSWLRYSMMPGCTCWTKKRPRLCSYRDPLAGRWGGWRGSGQEHKLDTLEPGALCDSQPFPAAAGWEAPTPKIAPRIMICLLEMTSLWTALNYSHTVSLTFLPVPRKQLYPWKSRCTIHPTEGLSECLCSLCSQET